MSSPDNPHYLDLVRELREAVGLFAGAMPITPKQAWDQAIAEVKLLRAADHHECPVESDKP